MVEVDEAAQLEDRNPELYRPLSSLHEKGSAVLVATQQVSPGLQGFIDKVHPLVINLD